MKAIFSVNPICKAVGTITDGYGYDILEIQRDNDGEFFFRREHEIELLEEVGNILFVSPWQAKILSSANEVLQKQGKQPIYHFRVKKNLAKKVQMFGV